MSSDSRRRGPAAALLLVAFGSGLFLLGQEARAVTYSYEGNNFISVSGPYDTSMRVTGSFELASPLPPNLPRVDITPSLQSFSFSDGFMTRTSADSNNCDFVVETNSAGEIVNWLISLAEAGVAPGDTQHGIATEAGVPPADVGSLGTATSDPCITSGITELGSSFGSPAGTWTSSAPAPALPGAWAVLLGGLLILLALASLGRVRGRALHPPFLGQR